MEYPIEFGLNFEYIEKLGLRPGIWYHISFNYKDGAIRELTIIETERLPSAIDD